MKIDNRSIGVFDSGVGGLTVLRNLIKQFPNEQFLYVGDTLRCPYGTKNKDELEKIVESDIHYLKKQNVKMIIIACNTATANSYHIKSSVPIIRIIEPTCKIALQYSGKTAVLATNYTIQSNAYQKFLGNGVIGIGCSEWVDIIENNELNTIKSKNSVEKLLKDLKNNVNNIVLGCTHFGLIEKEIKEFLGDDINIIDSSNSLFDVIKENLNNIGYNMTKSIKKPIITVTKDPSNLNISWFEGINISEIELVEIKND